VPDNMLVTLEPFYRQDLTTSQNNNIKKTIYEIY